MVFSSLVFLFGFLPPCIMIGTLLHRRIDLQNLFLLFVSLLFYAWGEPRRVLLFVITIFLNWSLVILSARADSDKGRKTLGIAAITIDILILFWFKYAGWLGRGIGLEIGSATLPIGVSFYIFQAISYVADATLLGKYEAEKSPVNVGLYIAFFPQLIAGPIVRYEEMRDQIRNRRMTLDRFEQGCFRFIFGFCKKVLLADTVAVIANRAFSLGGDLTSSFAWIGAIAYTFQIFMDFSGYSDMAIGLGAMFGFKIPENFNCPYRASSIRDFWRRWHITLSVWFRDYVYIPLGGSRKGDRRTILNVAVVWLLTGIWHGANWTFILWGVIYGALVLTEKIIDIDRHIREWNSVKRVAYRMFSLLAIMLLWVLFRAENISSAAAYVGSMFKFGSEGISEAVLYISEMKWSLIGCTVLSVVPYDKINRKRTVLWPMILILFLVSVSYLVKGTFSPFLYFNF
ncbi:MAG: MBOAT family protein [Mogibacterium sp.]|nr:MBOAT family protein [Mogibacterium sp.]